MSKCMKLAVIILVIAVFDVCQKSKQNTSNTNSTNEINWKYAYQSTIYSGATAHSCDESKKKRQE